MSRHPKVYDRLDRTYRRLMLAITFVLVTVLITLGVTLVFMSKSPQEKVAKRKLTIALVNEDVPASFNKQAYHFGKQFVDLVAGDNTYNWQVVSRSVADRAYSDRSIDAIIYLPQTFSHDILTLEDLNPRQAKVTYKTQKQADALSEKILQDKITTNLNDFNHSVVKMYYASVAGNIAEAESQMNAALGKQESLVEGLINQVNHPFKALLPAYSSLVARASSLKGEDSAALAKQTGVTEAVTSLMAQTEAGLSAYLPQVSSTLEEQSQVADLNVQTANLALKKQEEIAGKTYFDQFDALYGTAVKQLENFYQAGGKSESGHLATLKTRITEYNTLIDDVRSDLADQIQTLTTKRDELLGIEADLYGQFFAQGLVATSDDFDSFSGLQSSENARLGLAGKLQTSFGQTDNLTGSGILDHLQNVISQLSVNPSDYQLDDLVAHGVIDDIMRNRYLGELQVIGQYASAFGMTSKSGGVMLAPPAPETINQHMTRQVTIQVPAGAVYRSSALPIEVRVTAISGLVKVNEDGTITLDNVTGLSPRPPASLRPVDPDKPIPVNPNSPEGSPKNFSFSYEVNLGDKTDFSLPVTWTNQETGEQVLATTDNFSLLPRPTDATYNGYLKDNFQVLSRVLASIDEAAGLIAGFYAGPGGTYQDLLGTTSLEGFMSYHPESVASLYGNMNLAQIAARLSDSDVADFKSQGDNDIAKMLEVIRGLNQSIISLQADQDKLAERLPDTYFEEQIRQLEDWYAAAQVSLAGAHQDFQPLEGESLGVKAWSGSADGEAVLYKPLGRQLYERLEELMASTKDASSQVTSGMQVIATTSGQFDQFDQAASDAENNIKQLLGQSESLVGQGQLGVSATREFYDGFSKTLVNTRTPGVDSQGIYSFFASPLVSEDLTPKMTTSTQVIQGFDWRWLIVFMLGLVFDGFLMALVAAIRGRKTGNIPS